MRYRVGLLAVAVIAVGLTGCGSTENKPQNKVIFQGVDPIEGTTDTYQVGMNDTGHFIQVFSEVSWDVELFFPNPETQGWATISRSAGVGNNKILLSYDRNADASRMVVINFYFDGKEKTITFTQLGLGGGNMQQLDLWLEIPETPATLSKSCLTITHFIPNRLGMRNYTVLYDTLNYYPVWVAYPIHSSYNGGSGRTDKWAFDTSVLTSNQPNMLYGMGNGYDRGHMLPSASRYVTTLANNQTFYFTNMTAQMNSFNAEVWADLEGRVRNWGKYTLSGQNDTLYVVTGAVLKRVDIADTANSKVNCKGKQIPVPKYYYKALLMKKSTGGYKAIAWWYRHQATYRDVLETDAISIDSLEVMTGIDFFRNLSESEQATAEAMVWSNSDWKLY